MKLWRGYTAPVLKQVASAEKGQLNLTKGGFMDWNKVLCIMIAAVAGIACEEVLFRLFVRVLCRFFPGLRL